MDTSDAVARLGATMAKVEKRAQANIADARATRDEFKAISDNGDAPPLLTSKFYGRLVALTQTYAADLLELHHQMTEEAKARDIDVPPAAPSDDDEEIGILSGGGR